MDKRKISMMATPLFLEVTVIKRVYWDFLKGSSHGCNIWHTRWNVGTKPECQRE